MKRTAKQITNQAPALYLSKNLARKTLHLAFDRKLLEADLCKLLPKEEDGCNRATD